MSSTEADDRLAIRDVVERFSTYMTLRDNEAVGRLFVPDGVWDTGPPYDIVVTGADKIAQAIGGTKTVFEYMIQMLHQVVIDLDGDRATARSVLDEVCRKAGGEGGVRLRGMYVDELVRTDAGWRFARRNYRAITMEQVTPGGDYIGAI